MAVSATNLVANTNTTAGTSFATASISPTANKLELLSFLVVNNDDSTDPLTPTVTGAGLTWVEVDSSLYDPDSASRRKLFTFRAMGSSPSAGALTIDFGSVTHKSIIYSVDEFTGMDTSGTNGSGAIVQSLNNEVTDASASTLTVTLSAFSNIGNATFGAFAANNSSNTTTAGTGFAKLGDYLGAGRLMTEFRDDNDTTVDFTLSTTSDLGGIAIEIRASGQIYVDATSSKEQDASTTATWSHTNAGDILGVVTANYDATNDTDGVVTGVTYNGVALTKASDAVYATLGMTCSAWYLIAPATGANNIVVTTAGTTSNIKCAAASYIGANQTGQPDANVTSTTTTGKVRNNTFTTTADGCQRLDIFESYDATWASVGAGQTNFFTSGGGYVKATYSGPITPAGSDTDSATSNAAVNDRMIGAGIAFSPYVSAGTTTRRYSLTTLGVG